MSLMDATGWQSVPVEDVVAGDWITVVGTVEVQVLEVTRHPGGTWSVVHEAGIRCGIAPGTLIHCRPDRGASEDPGIPGVA